MLIIADKEERAAAVCVLRKTDEYHGSPAQLIPGTLDLKWRFLPDDVLESRWERGSGL